jgi:hypothetical protein
VEVIQSSSRRCAHTPAAIASSPAYEWIVPQILFSPNSAVARSSNPRIFRIVR